MKQKQPDLANMFYHQNGKQSDESSNHHSKKSFGTVSRSNVSTGLNQPQQFTLTKKINMMQNTDTASTSRERTLRLKKQVPTDQLQHGALLKESATTTAANSFQNSSTNAGGSGFIPQVGKRRPLVIRKNNFVQKGDTDSSIDPRARNMVI